MQDIWQRQCTSEKDVVSCLFAFAVPSVSRINVWKNYGMASWCTKSTLSTCAPTARHIYQKKTFRTAQSECAKGGHAAERTPSAQSTALLPAAAAPPKQQGGLGSPSAFAMSTQAPGTAGVQLRHAPAATLTPPRREASIRGSASAFFLAPFLSGTKAGSGPSTCA